MTKTKGVPLPDPKVWKWCKHPECIGKAKKVFLRKDGSELFFGIGGSDEQKLMRLNSELCVVFHEDYCWKHLREKAKAAYKAKIKKLVETEHSLEGANLQRTNLQKTMLWGADLQKANLKSANFQKAYLPQANLQKANLQEAHLQGTHLQGARLQEAYLSVANLQGAHLRAAYLQEAHLWGVHLQGASLFNANLQKAELFGANLQGAKLEGAELYGSFLQGVKLDGAHGLTWERIKRVGEENTKTWDEAKDAYRRLKNYFHQQGRYDDESKAYYREKLMAKHEAYEQCFKEKQPKNFFNWFGLWLLWAVAGFGERWMRIIPWGAIILLFFTGLFFLGSNLGWGAPYDHPTLLSIGNLFDCFVFSVVTFVTLGFGKIWSSAWLAKALIILEAGLGFVFLGMFVVLIARKFGR